MMETVLLISAQLPQVKTDYLNYGEIILDFQPNL